MIERIQIKRVVAVSMIMFAFACVKLQASSVVNECKKGKNTVPYGFWTWPANSNIEVFVVLPDFSPEELTHLLEPFKEWNSVSEATGSHVRFSYQGNTRGQLTCENCLTIRRGPVFDKKKRHATELRAYSAHRDQIITYATIVIDPVLTNPKAIADAIAHEVGHSFGLLDCYNCKPQNTVMAQFKSLNLSNGHRGPTQCDVAQVRKFYLQLAARSHSAPARQTVRQVDEGEEPVDDDTPVVLPQP